jgi:hypothetical protein
MRIQKSFLTSKSYLCERQPKIPPIHAWYQCPNYQVRALNENCNAVDTHNGITLISALTYFSGFWEYQAANSKEVFPQQAIYGYTLGGAFAAKREKTEDSIEAGKLADAIIVSQDLFKIKPNQIGNTKVLMTIVGGKIAYQDPSWEGARPADSK